MYFNDSKPQCPEVLTMDLNTHALEKFVLTYEFEHFANIPRYTTSNSETERDVQTLKYMLENEDDV